MKKIKVLLLLLLSGFLFGCAGKQDINQLILVSAIGIDKTEDGFKMVAQIVNRNILVPDPPQITPVFVITSEGESMFECLRNLNDLLPNRAYLINLQLLVFSEDIAKEGIFDYIHFFANYSEAQHEYNVMITKGITTEELLGQISVFSQFPTRILISKLETSIKEYGFGKKTFVDQVYSDIRSETNTLVLSSVEVTGDLKKGSNVDQNKDTEIASKIKISDLAIFDGDKLIGWLNKEESTTYNFIMGEIDVTVIVVDGDEDNKISNVIRNVKGKVKVDVINNMPRVSITIKMDASVVEDTKGKLDLDKNYLKLVENRLNEKLKKDIEELIKKSQNELNIDLFCIQDKFFKKHPKWWKENKDNFRELYKDMDIEVKVETTVIRLDL